jgi:hypothetical protein
LFSLVLARPAAINNREYKKHTQEEAEKSSFKYFIYYFQVMSAAAASNEMRR